MEYIQLISHIILNTSIALKLLCSEYTCWLPKLKMQDSGDEFLNQGTPDSLKKHVSNHWFTNLKGWIWYFWVIGINLW